MAQLRYPVLVCVLSALGACKEPIPGECFGEPGALCLSVRNADNFPPGLRVVLDVRVGSCDGVPPFPCQGGAMAATAPGCRLSCQDLPVPERFTGAEGRFTAEINLVASPGAGQAAARVYDGAEKEGCAGQAQVPFASGDAAVLLDPKASACPVRPRRCRSHVDCGGPSAAQVCDKGVCTDPPANVCPGEMTFIPAGSFVLGNPDAMTGKDRACKNGVDLVRHRVTRPFCMDRTEATVAQFRGCVGAGCSAPMGVGCTYQSGSDEHAVNCLTYSQAAAYCRFRTWNGQNGRLPTEAEWEWAAGRDPKRRYPWDDRAPADLCEYANGSAGVMAFCEPDPLRVRRPGQTPKGNSPAAPEAPWPKLPLIDLAGNLAEWVADAAPMGLHSYCELQPLDDPLNPTGTNRIVRGGSYADLPATLYTYARNEFPAVSMTDLALLRTTGVRCVLNPTLPTP